MTTITDTWSEPAQREPAPSDVMHVEVDGYEGPLDLLLDLARRQKVDLAQISVLALAEQYLVYIASLREKRIDLAADYLVMAAWLAYLKSRLMVPQIGSEEEPSGEAMAALLQFRLKRLEAMRLAGRRLTDQPRLGIDLFARGMPEAIAVTRRPRWEASLFDLLKAYARQRERALPPTDYAPRARQVLSLQEARESLGRLIGTTLDWVALESFLARYLAPVENRASVLASSFSASLELARQGVVELRQAGAFAPLFLRRRQGDAPPR